MDLIYKPELDNPPMDPESTIGFSFIKENVGTSNITIPAGIWRDFPQEVWEQIKEYTVTKTLIKLGAIKVTKSTAPSPEGDELVPATVDLDSIADVALPTALGYIAASFDGAQLERWQAKDQRVKVVNAIAARLTALAGGRG